MSTEKKFWVVLSLAGVGGLLYLLGPILTPFLVGALLAWLGNPLVAHLQRWRIPRGIAVIAVFLCIMLVLPLLLLLIVPMVVREFASLLAHAPAAITWFQNTAAPWLAAHLNLDPQELQLQNLGSLLTDNIESTGKFAGNALLTVSHSTHTVFLIFVDLLLIPIVTFYLLRDWNAMLTRIVQLLPRAQVPIVERLARDCDAVLAAFFRGQLLVMLCMAAIYSVGLSIVGLESAAAIGVIAGFLGFVPYLGIATGIVLALLTALLQGGGWLLLWVLLVFAFGHLMESWLLTPRLIGQRIGLHPVLVIFAILAGGELFGFVGVLLALPAAAAAKVFLQLLGEHYAHGDQQGGGGAVS
jgi:predicted PurR-regulated permease PerM